MDILGYLGTSRDLVRYRFEANSQMVLCRNLLEHNSPSKTVSPSLKRYIQLHMNRIRKELTHHQLHGFDLDNSFSQLSTFAEQNQFSVFRSFAQAQRSRGTVSFSTIWVWCALQWNQGWTRHCADRLWPFGSLRKLANAFRTIVMASSLGGDFNWMATSPVICVAAVLIVSSSA